MVDLSMLDPRFAAIIAGMRERFPQVKITSGFRDPQYNASVGGARGSQHLGGKAFDFSVRGMPEDQQRAVAMYLREQGVQGFGYYPDSQSMHADIGSARFWGPDKTSKSLGRTPSWFQEFAGMKPQQTEVAAAPAQQPQQTAAAAAPVYSNDLMTAARYWGNKMLPNQIDAPTPLTAEEAKAQPAEMGQFSGANFTKAAGGLLNLAKLLQDQQQPEPEIMPAPMPERRRVAFRPLPMMRGLL
jgi:hypothetical protein